MTAPGQPEQPEESKLRSVRTSNLPGLFQQLNISLVVSTYRAGKVVLVRNDEGTINTHFRSFFSSPWELRRMPTGRPSAGPTLSATTGTCREVTNILLF